MGTNYYLKHEECPTCGHIEERIHLGKSSTGWKFLFNLNNKLYYKDVPTMKKWLKDKEIWDEYGAKIEHKEFWVLVKRKQKEKLVGHYQEFSIGGYRFVNHEFS